MININDLYKERADSEKMYTIDYLLGVLMHYQQVLIKNKIDPKKCPVVVRKHNEYFAINFATLQQSDNAMVTFDFSKYSKIDFYTCIDERPEHGEYWRSRGASSSDVSGYVVSKEAGTRIMLLTKYVLEREEISSYLDWRKYEPNYIQFKFSAKEFDVEKLHELTKETGIITEEILREAKL